jgi:SAM-dependent methyltransferase
VRTLYQRDLAWIHHHGYGRFARDAGPQLLRILRAAGIRKGTIVDLACGSGIWADTATRAGFNVLGIDRSKTMLDLARQVAPKAQFRCASLHSFELSPCDVVTIIGEGIQYLQPNQTKLPPFRPLFQRISRALRPGGMLIFDAIARSRKPYNFFHGRAGRDWATCVEAKQKGNFLVREIAAFRKIKGTWNRSDERHRVYLIDVETTNATLRSCGFKVQVVRKYGTIELAPNRVAFIATKPR